MAKNKNIPNIHREFADNFPKNIFHEISPEPTFFVDFPIF